MCERGCRRCRSPLGVDGHVFDFKHLGDGCDAGDGVFGELADAVRKGAEELVADVDGAAAHAGDNACVFRLGAAKLGEDHVVAGAACAAQNPKDFNLHGLGFGPGENGPRSGYLAAVHLVEREKALTGRWRAGGWGLGGKERGGESGKQDGRQSRAQDSGKRSNRSPECLMAEFHVYKSKPVPHCPGRLRVLSDCHALRF